MSDGMYDKEDFTITVRRYGGGWSAHCWHRTGDGYGHSWSNFTESADNHWEMISTHIRIHHTKTKEEKANARVNGDADITASRKAGSGNPTPAR